MIVDFNKEIANIKEALAACAQKSRECKRSCARFADTIREDVSVVGKLLMVNIFLAVVAAASGFMVAGIIAAVFAILSLVAVFRIDTDGCGCFGETCCGSACSGGSCDSVCKSMSRLKIMYTKSFDRATDLQSDLNRKSDELIKAKKDNSNLIKKNKLLESRVNALSNELKAFASEGKPASTKTKRTRKSSSVKK